MSAPQQGIQLLSPTRKAAYASAAATIVMSGEHRGNDRAFPVCVTNLHDLPQVRYRHDADFVSHSDRGQLLLMQ
jgi:hypothetical protein